MNREMKRALLLTLIACAASAFPASAQKRRGAAGAARQPAAKQAPAKGAGAAKQGAPAVNVQVVDAEGLAALVKSGAAKGQPLLVNFWATWCGPCREEFPDLIRVAEEFGRGKEFEFVSVSTDDPAELKAGVTEFLASVHAESIPAYLFSAADPEPAIAAVDKSWSGELPATFLYGRDGRLLFRHTGRIKVEELRAALAAALKKDE